MFTNVQNESTICTALERVTGEMISKMNFELCSKSQKLEFYAEFNATEDSMKTNVRHLKDWLKKQPHLPDVAGKQGPFLAYLWPWANHFVCLPPLRF